MSQKIMSAEEAKRYAQDLCKAGIKNLQESDHVYRQLIDQIPTDHELRREHWILQAHLKAHWSFFSQHGQDKYIYERFFQSATEGFFVDVGAFDGVEGSNTLFFERTLGWRGLCIEASPSRLAELQKNRRTPCLNVAVGDGRTTEAYLEVTAGYTMMGGLLSELPDAQLVRNNSHFVGQEISVSVKPLSDILDEQHITSVDYCSIDVEGAEMRVLKGIDFDRHRIAVLSIENFSRLGENPGTEVKDFMESRGYRYVDAVGLDEIYALP